MNTRQKAAFRKTVYDYYKKAGRHDLPWRATKDPYKIAVSEIMLQQTQVSRVSEKYKEFLKAFPTVHSLANAPLQQVLFHWSGLGYNRRARFLQQMAQAIVGGKFASTFDTLLELPGIGHYTAGAIMAFAYNQPIVFIENNIRTVYLYHFFPQSLREIVERNSNSSKESTKISDKELLPLIEVTLDQHHPREWYWALMDYGAYLKTQGIKIHRNSTHYKKQSAFQGSLRQVRGAIIKALAIQPATIVQLQKITGFEKERIIAATQTLIKEMMLMKQGKLFNIHETKGI